MFVSVVTIILNIMSKTEVQFFKILRVITACNRKSQK